MEETGSGYLACGEYFVIDQLDNKNILKAANKHEAGRDMYFDACGKKITEHETCISTFILCAPQFVCVHAKHLIKHNSLQAATF